MRNDEGRTANSLRNTKVIFLVYVLNVVLQFVSRSIFLHFLSVDYLGVNGLFSNVLSMLNLAELGIGSAMAYALYKPCAESNYDLISQIMTLYKRLYTIIGIAVLGVGVSLTPFLHYLVDDIPEHIGDIRIYYVLYVLSTSASYFFSYKRTIIVCYQKQYIVSLANFAKNVVVLICEILILNLTRSYLFYLIAQICCTIAENFFLSVIADKRYPFIRGRHSLPPKEISQSIKKNILAMSCHKIGGVVVNGTDNIIITKFVSLTATGLYSNYAVVLTAFTSLVTQVFSAITASVGNLISQEKDDDKVYSVFERIYFINFVIYAFAGIGAYVIFDDVIRIWIGEQYVLPHAAILCAILSFVTNGMRRTVLMFKDAYGLFWKDRFKPLLEALCNVVLSIPLAIRFGIAGTFIGTILTNIFVSGLIESFVLFKFGVHKNVGKYFLQQCVYFMFITLHIVIFDELFSLFVLSPILDLIVKGAATVSVLILSIYLVFGRSDKWTYAVTSAKKLLHLSK